MSLIPLFFFFSSRRRHTRLQGDWSSDVCSSDLDPLTRRRYCVASPAKVSRRELGPQWRQGPPCEMRTRGKRRSTVDIMRASHIALVAALLGVTASLSTGCNDAAAPMPTTGAIGITATTTGADLDADGYGVSVDGGPGRAIGTNGTLAISGL